MTQREPSSAELRAAPARNIYLVPLASTPVPDGANAMYR